MSYRFKVVGTYFTQRRQRNYLTTWALKALPGTYLRTTLEPYVVPPIKSSKRQLSPWLPGNGLLRSSQGELSA